jgi:hypothetical protein
MTDWLGMLGSSSIAERDRATVALIDRGIAALPEIRRLTKDDATEPTLRARATWALVGIVRLNQSARSASGPDTISLHHRGALREALRQLEDLGGVTVETDQPDDGEVIVALDGASLLRAIDHIANVASLDWKVARGPSIRFIAGPGIECPTTYAGFFRIRVARIDIERSTDFRLVRTSARFQIAITMDPTMISLGRPLLRELRVFAGEGPPLAAEIAGADERSGDAAPGVARYICRVTVPPSSRRIERMEGTVACLFPRSPINLVIEKPQRGQETAAGAVRIRVDQSGPDGYALRVLDDAGQSPKISGADEHLISRTVLGIDDAGREALAQTKLHTSVGMVGGVEQRKTSLRVSFDRADFGPLHSIRLRVVDKVLLNNTPFTLQGFEYP